VLLPTIATVHAVELLPTVQQAVLLAAAAERCERLDLGAQRPGGTIVRALQRRLPARGTER